MATVTTAAIITVFAPTAFIKLPLTTAASNATAAEDVAVVMPAVVVVACAVIVASIAIRLASAASTEIGAV